MSQEPRAEEMIYGCSCSTACGQVATVERHVTENGWNHWLVTESFRRRPTRVRRESNGLLYEVTFGYTDD